MRGERLLGAFAAASRPSTVLGATLSEVEGSQAASRQPDAASREPRAAS